MPVGMHGYRLEVEAHIITAAQGTVRKPAPVRRRSWGGSAAVRAEPAGLRDVVLTDGERNMGVAVCTSAAGPPTWHIRGWACLAHHGVGVGEPYHQYIATGLRLPLAQAEEIKIKYGYALKSGVSVEELLTVKAYGEDAPVRSAARTGTHH